VPLSSTERWAALCRIIQAVTTMCVAC
jgi:hypothetical protein